MKNFLVGVILILAASGAAYSQARTASQIQTAPFSQLTTDLPSATVRVCINCQANAATGVCESGAYQMVATRLDDAWKCTKYDPNENGGGIWGSITGTLSNQTDLQTALNLKATLASPTFTGTVTIPTPFTLAAVSVLPTGTELNFVDGVTSAIQTQLDAKTPTSRTVSTSSPLGGGGALSGNLTLTCATCVTSAAPLTSTALVTGAGSQGSQTPSATATLDSSGNLSTAGSLATGVGGAVAGNIGLGQGTATSVAVNTIQHQAPTSVTGYNLVYPSAAGSGLLQWTNSTDVMTGTLSALTSGRVTFATTNGLLSDDADLTFATDTLTATKIIGSTSATSATYLTATNCADSAGAAACGSAAAGSVVIDAAGTSVVVSTTAVTANSQIFIQEDSSLNTRLSVTCNTVTGRLYTVTARTAATSFTITTSAAPITDPACLSYKIVN